MEQIRARFSGLVAFLLLLAIAAPALAVVTEDGPPTN